MPTTNTLESLRYPVGRFTFQPDYGAAQKREYIETIRNLPGQLNAKLQMLTEEQIATPYRPEGWTIRQVVHHVADSHMNAYIRFKLALTEDNPTIKPYDEAAWAKLPDTQQTPLSVSLNLLEAVHHRWVIILESLTDNDLQRTVVHPEYGKVISLKEFLALYAWHSRHHLAHIGLVG